MDGVEGKEYDGIMEGNPVFSPDSKRVAYAANRGGKWLVVVDGMAGKEYDGILAGTPVFSPDGKRVAYAAERGSNWLVVLDGAEGKKYDDLRNSSLAFDSPSELHTLASRVGEFLRVELRIVTPTATPSGESPPHR